MSGITTHVLDTSRGRPASGVPVTLELQAAGDWKLLSEGTTNADGRVTDLLGGDAGVAAGLYRLTFDTATYFAVNETQSFYPQVSVVFRIEDPNQHYHVPLLLSPFGYSTYRGS
jgi:5-hydroxyisourate hydrolase